MARKIPRTMATQHPDNAFPPYWQPGSKFVDTKSEVEECWRSFNDLKCGEYMWDWEGKHVDEAVMERLFEKHHKFFSRKQLGKDVFLTFRIPNPWVEKGYRVARAFVNITSANDLAKDSGLHAPPVFEAILPMTQSGRQLFFVRKNYAELARALEAFGESGPDEIEVIPLIESPALMAGADKILEDYVARCVRDGSAGGKPERLRPFIARSDPALNSGMVPAILAAKLGLAKCFEFGEKHGVPVHPIIGVGSLPFRGWLSPETVRQFCEEYRGVHTATVQPSFRYDHEKGRVRSAISKLETSLGKRPPEMPPSSQARLKQIVHIFEKHYKTTVERLAGDVNSVALSVPARRERRLHIGLFGYSRKVGSKSLPRAISFTASCYSLGVPPEFIGLGRGLEEVKRKGLLRDLEEEVKMLRPSIKFAGGFLNKQNLVALARRNVGWRKVAEDVAKTEEWLGESLGPENESESMHANLSTNVRLLVSKNKPAFKEIERMAELRKSLG